MLARADWKTGLLVAHIWRQSVAGGPPTQLTSGESGELLARWSPDSRTLLYLSRGQIWLIPAAEARLGNSRDMPLASTAALHPRGLPTARRSIFSRTIRQPMRSANETACETTSIVFEQDFRQHHLWKIAVDSGAEQKLTDGPFSILWFHVSSDGTRILEQRAPTPLFEDLGRGETWITDSRWTNTRGR